MFEQGQVLFISEVWLHGMVTT